VDIPDIKTPVVAGFSVGAIWAALSKLDTQQPLKLVVDNIKAGNIRSAYAYSPAVTTSRSRRF
jgi:carbon-monoxide dehydrogenase catalytic subunit